MSHDNEHIKCPFLNDNSCSVYENRPFMCRKYYNFPDEDGICALVKYSGKEKPEVYTISSPNIEYAYSLINNRFCKRKKLFNHHIDLKKYYKDCEKSVIVHSISEDKK